MIYLDTSCLLKLLFDEPESAAVRTAVDGEEVVVISSLVELEAEVQLRAAAEGGDIRRSQWRRHQAKLAAMRSFDPFHFRPLGSAVFPIALHRHRTSGSRYCRTLDRLHLGAIEELKLRRLMTLDRAQAKAAEALGIEVLRPGQQRTASE